MLQYTPSPSATRPIRVRVISGRDDLSRAKTKKQRAKIALAVIEGATLYDLTKKQSHNCAASAPRRALGVRTAAGSVHGRSAMPTRLVVEIGCDRIMAALDKLTSPVLEAAE